METVKVDIQKLQLLNDRIAQTIDALNQVRVSVHGIQHTSATPQQLGVGYGMGVPNPFVQASPFMQASPFVPQTPFVQPGIMHTQAGIPMVNPQLLAAQNQLQLPLVYGGGISHTAQIDPYFAMRLAQTFPFAAYWYPPLELR